MTVCAQYVMLLSVHNNVLGICVYYTKILKMYSATYIIDSFTKKYFHENVIFKDVH